MVGFTLHNTPFPDGTSVGIYDATGYLEPPASGPPGNPVTTATASARTVAVDDVLEYGTAYFAMAEVAGKWRSVRFVTATLQEPEAWQSALEERFSGVTLKDAALPSSVVTDSAASPKKIDSTGVNTLDLLGYNGTKYAPADQAAISAGFANPFDSVFFIAGAQRENPVLQSQGLYIQHRVKGDLGGKVHDGAATELRLTEASNGGTGQNAFEASVVVTAGATSLAQVNGLLVNFKTEGEPTGTIENLRIAQIQPVETLAAGLTVTNLYGLYVGAQSKGTNNYSLYVNGGTSVIRGTVRPSAKAEPGLVIRGLESQEGSLLTIQSSASATLFNVTAAGSVRVGSGLATTATDGFLYLPSSNGPPTGVPTSQTGCIAFQYDRANNKLYAYNGGWKSVALV